MCEKGSVWNVSLYFSVVSPKKICHFLHLERKGLMDSAWKNILRCIFMLFCPKTLQTFCSSMRFVCKPDHVRYLDTCLVADVCKMRPLRASPPTTLNFYIYTFFFFLFTWILIQTHQHLASLMIPFIKACNETAALLGFHRARSAKAEVETKQRAAREAISSTLPPLEDLHSSWSYSAADFLHRDSVTSPQAERKTSMCMLLTALKPLSSPRTRYLNCMEKDFIWARGSENILHDTSGTLCYEFLPILVFYNVPTKC